MQAFNNVVANNVDSTATSKFFAVTDAYKRNAANISKYAEADIALADNFYNTVCNTFLRSRVYKNYRATFIAVKVDNVQKADLATLKAQDLEQLCAELNVTVKRTRNALIFRLA